MEEPKLGSGMDSAAPCSPDLWDTVLHDSLLLLWEKKHPKDNFRKQETPTLEHTLDMRTSTKQTCKFLFFYVTFCSDNFTFSDTGSYFFHLKLWYTEIKNILSSDVHTKH